MVLQCPLHDIRPGSSNPNNANPIINRKLDPSAEKQRGRYIPAALEILVKEVVVGLRSAQWFS